VNPVDVYFNLHRAVWSVRCRKSGLVTDHHRVVVFPLGASMVVRAAGHSKALQTGQKNVHAFVRGNAPETSDNVAEWLAVANNLPRATRATYNPKRAAHFTLTDTGERIDSASAVVMIAPEGEAPQMWIIRK
jgi:hypothetical protein